MSKRPVFNLLTLDDRLELARYEAFRRVRAIRNAFCRDVEGKKFLTRVMRRLKEVPGFSQ